VLLNRRDFAMNINEVSRLLDIPRSTIRYWESEGLLRPVREDSNNYRQYNRNDIIQVSDIWLYRMLGMSVKEIHDWRLHCKTSSEIRECLEQLDISIQKNIDEFQNRQKRLRMRLSAIQRLDNLLLQEYRFVSPDEFSQMESITEFSLFNHENYSFYIKNPYSMQYVLFYEAGCYASSIDGWLNSDVKMPGKTLWKKRKNDVGFLECCLIANSDNICENNLEQHLSYLRDKKLSPGAVIARYITDMYDKTTGRNSAYYHCLIEIPMEKV